MWRWLWLSTLVVVAGAGNTKAGLAIDLAPRLPAHTSHTQLPTLGAPPATDGHSLGVLWGGGLWEGNSLLRTNFNGGSFPSLRTTLMSLLTYPLPPLCASVPLRRYCDLMASISNSLPSSSSSSAAGINSIPSVASFFSTGSAFAGSFAAGEGAACSPFEDVSLSC